MSPAAPCEGAETVSFTIGIRLRSLKKMMPPVVKIDLPLEVILSPIVSCFFGTVAHWTGF